VKAAYTYVIAAKVPGRLLSLKKRIGDRVGRDEIVGQIDDTEYRLAIDEAKAQVRISYAAVADAQAQSSHSVDSCWN
jgi:multidrug resistance efflux pump